MFRPLTLNIYNLGDKFNRLLANKRFCEAHRLVFLGIEALIVIVTTRLPSKTPWNLLIGASRFRPRNNVTNIQKVEAIHHKESI